MAKLKTVEIDVKYGETVEGDVMRNYQARVALTFSLDKDEEKDWKEGDKIDSVRRWMSETLKDSVHREMEEDGVRSRDEDDEPEEETDDGDGDDEKEEDADGEEGGDDGDADDDDGDGDDEGGDDDDDDDDGDDDDDDGDDDDD